MNLQGDLVPMDEQLKNHRTIVSRITRMLGSKDSALKHLNKCIYTVDMGNNDYLMNYFIPQFYNTSRQYNVEQYATALIQQYSEQLKVSTFISYVATSYLLKIWNKNKIIKSVSLFYIYIKKKLVRRWSKEDNCDGIGSRRMPPTFIGYIWNKRLSVLRW